MSGKLATNKLKAIKAIVEGHGLDAAALVAGVTARTLYTWRTDDVDFQQELARQSDMVLGDATIKMKANMGTAVRVITDVMNDAAAPASVRVRAAQIMLETGLKLVEAAEVLARIDALERVYYEAQQGQNIKATR